MRRFKFLIKPIDNIFIDVMIFRDVFGRRHRRDGYPLWVTSLSVLFAVMSGEISVAYTSTLSLAGIAAEVKLIYNKEQANRVARNYINHFVKPFIKIVPITQSVIDAALSDGRGEFEDALIFYSAKECNSSCIVTRNVSDFELLADGTNIRILRPEDIVRRPSGW